MDVRADVFGGWVRVAVVEADVCVDLDDVVVDVVVDVSSVRFEDVDDVDDLRLDGGE